MASRSDRVGDSFEHFARDQGLRLVLAFLGTVVLVRLVRIVLYRVQRRLEASALAQRGAADPGRIKALFDVFTYLGVAFVVIVGVMTGLSVLGVNTGALLASAGVFGFALGFGAQTMVRDLLNGLFLLAEGQYTIGDHIQVNNVNGVVERFTLRTTTLRDSNGDVHIVASGDIRLVTNKTKGYSRVVIDVGFPHVMPVDDALRLMARFCEEMSASPAYASDLVEPFKLLGVEAIQEHQVLIRFSVKVLPHRRNDTARGVRQELVRLFEREGIEVPSAGGPAINISVPGSTGTAPPAPAR